MIKVAVLMSTYNGQKYLCEQIDSIVNQTGVCVEIFIRDDGSSDSTRDILADYVEKYSNIHVDFAENVGVGNSFMNVLYSVNGDFDYFAFADQDDIWLKDKLYEAVKMLQKNNKNLYVSNQECVDKDGNSLGLRWMIDDERVFLSPIGIVSQNVLCGCTMVFTDEFYRLLIKDNVRPSSSVLTTKNHDGWIASVAALFDDIIYDNRSFIKYRQHGGNVVGAYQQKAKLSKRIKVKIRKLFNPELRNYRSNTARELRKSFPEKIKEHPMIEMCANSKTLKGKMKIIKNSRLFRVYTNENYITFYTKVIFGLF